MRAINYARHRTTRQIVFFAKGESPPDEMIDTSWAWFVPPVHPRANEVMLIGESTVNWQDRMRGKRDPQPLRH